ncbi:hypothetical protein [uncultured Desulfobacter sp.]|uniref:hypothetical protein n=1 Tax=uncultured Desulfobacter sp. TaxID=240139 RepID=UPI0029C90BF2|nr:hypothetical protein [uncultured Desulfobacter sp.]
MSEQSAFNEVVRIVTELNVPIAEITALCDLIGRKNVVKGLRSQGEGKFKETLLVFYKIGIEKCVNYISILNDKEVIGQNHISHDFARAPYSIARTLQFLDNKDIEIKDLYIIVPRLKNAVGERSFERGFPSWSLYYFFVTIKKVKTIGVDKAVRIILMLKDLFGQEHLEGAYEQGYLWFVEAIEIFFQIGISKSRKLIEDFRDRSNIHYFNTAFAHNPRSFARYIKLKSEAPDKEIDFVIAERKVNSGKIIALLHGLLEEHFDDGEYLCLTSSEFIAFVFDAVTKYFEGEKNEKIAIFLKNKYFSGLAKRNVYSLLRSIGPEIEVQKGLKTYDVETAHMAAFFFLVETSGDALIEFPLGPANYHGSLSEIVRSMSKISIGKELLIPRNKVIPLDVSISLPPQLIHKVEFQKKATLLRVVNDLLYTADIRFATAFQAEPQDQSGIRFKKGLAKGIGSKGSDLAENRSGNLITDDGEKSVAQPLIAHEVSFKFYQMIYTALAASFMEESKKKELEKKLAGIYLNFERQVLGILKEEKVDYLIGIASNENLAFIEFSNARKGNMNITVRLDDAVQHYLSLINREILKEALRERVRQFSGDKRDVESEIKSEIKRQKDIDVKYGEALETAFGGIGVGRKNRG